MAAVLRPASNLRIVEAVCGCKETGFPGKIRCHADIR